MDLLNFCEIIFSKLLFLCNHFLEVVADGMFAIERDDWFMVSF